MSYDLYLFRVPEGMDPSEAYDEVMERDETEGDAPVAAADLEEMRRVADALKAWHPSFEEYAEQQPRPWIQLTEDDLEVQFSIGNGTVDINLPYFRERAEQMFRFVAEALEVVRGVTGYAAYDPQLGRVVTSDDLLEMGATYRSVDKSVLLEAIAQVGPKKPWWKFW